jgi:flagellar hook protein FlgE
MAFLRSLFSGVSALRNQQTMMDVIGNNIANVNTVGFKSGRATFSELYAQTLRGASRPTSSLGGTNPMQVGLGMSVNTLDTQFNQGNIETTGNSFDLALFGSAFFVVNKDGQPLYTRAGNFQMDADGRLVNGTGAILQGKMADAQGAIPPGNSLEDIIINRSIKSPATATSKIEYTGNLEPSADAYSAGPPQTGVITRSQVSVFDSLGNPMLLTLEFTSSGSNAWNWSASIPDPASTTGGTLPVGTGTVSFDSNGRLAAPPTGTPISITPTNGAAPLSIAFDFGTVGEFSGLTQTSGKSTVTGVADGFTSGTLKDVKIDSAGQIQGTFTNGTIQTLAMLMLAEFSNPSGLERAGENAFNLTGNSGSPGIVYAGGTTKIYSGSLEQSNVDLADEFTKMITAQRGFQASARVITTSDEFLQEVVNLKR